MKTGGYGRKDIQFDMLHQSIIVQRLYLLIDMGVILGIETLWVVETHLAHTYRTKFFAPLTFVMRGCKLSVQFVFLQRFRVLKRCVAQISSPPYTNSCVSQNTGAAYTDATHSWLHKSPALRNAKTSETIHCFLALARLLADAGAFSLLLFTCA